MSEGFLLLYAFLTYFFGVWFKRLLVWYILFQCLDCILGSPLEGKAQQRENCWSFALLQIWYTICVHYFCFGWVTVVVARYTFCTWGIVIRNVVKSVNVHSNLLNEWLFFCYIILCIWGWFLLSVTNVAFTTQQTKLNKKRKKKQEKSFVCLWKGLILEPKLWFLNNMVYRKN